MVVRDSSAFKFGKVEIALIQVSFHWLKSLTDKGAEETGSLRENLQQQASEDAKC